MAPMRRQHDRFAAFSDDVAWTSAECQVADDFAVAVAGDHRDDGTSGVFVDQPGRRKNVGVNVAVAVDREKAATDAGGVFRPKQVDDVVVSSCTGRRRWLWRFDFGRGRFRGVFRVAPQGEAPAVDTGFLKMELGGFIRLRVEQFCHIGKARQATQLKDGLDPG